MHLKDWETLQPFLSKRRNIWDRTASDCEKYGSPWKHTWLVLVGLVLRFHRLCLHFQGLTNIVCVSYHGRRSVVILVCWQSLELRLPYAESARYHEACVCVFVSKNSSHCFMGSCGARLGFYGAVQGCLGVHFQRQLKKRRCQKLIEISFVD